MVARAKKLTAAIASVVALVLCGANPLGAPKPRSGESGSGARGEPERLAPLQKSTRTADRIVSLVPPLTEMLFAVGAGSQVVGVSSYDDFPPEVQSRPRVGALLDPDVERILALKPDLVLVYGSQIELEGQFRRAGIRVYSYRHGGIGNGIGNVLETIRDLGALTGHRADGDRVAMQVRSQLDAVRARVRGRPRPRTMVVMGRDAMALRGVYVSGGIGFLHELLDLAGGEDVFGDVKREAVQPSNETMLVRAPEVIIELHPGDTPPPGMVQKERGVWSLLASMPAVRNGRIHLLYGEYLMAAGPRLPRVAETLARVLHPDAFIEANRTGRP
jgi:iron complex transport system substrate-binding protein